MPNREGAPSGDMERDRISSPSNADNFIIYALDCSAIVAITDTRGRIQLVSDRFVDISGYTRGELIGRNHRIVRSGSHDRAFFRRMYQTIARGRIWHGEICNREQSGALYWVDSTIVPRRNENGKITNYISISFDITARKLAEQNLKASRRKLQKAANTDFLTGISNRLHFTQFLRRALQSKSAGHVCLALLDIDTFKALNDTAGHDAGDRLLRRIAGKLEAFQTSRCFVARIGGDEFAILMTGTSPETARKIVTDVLQTMRFTLRQGTFLHHCTVSIGYTILQNRDIRERTLLKRADLALYAAKAAGRNDAREYLPEMEERHDRISSLRRQVEIGLREKSITVVYQPMVSLRSPCRVSLEAQLQWEHPTQKILSPAHFPEIFGDTRLSLSLSEFVTRQVVRDLSALQNGEDCPDRVAINITSSDFNSSDFLMKFMEAAEDHGIPLEKLVLEITANAFCQTDTVDIQSKLDLLAEKGVRISLDDFGAGFTSLNHLKVIAFDYVKINPDIVAGLEHHAVDSAIAKGVIDIAHSINRKVAAVGVETEIQFQTLIDMGCDFAQGSAISKAVPIDQIPQTIQNLKTSRLSRV